MLGHFDSITARFFGALAARLSLFLCFSEINREDSCSLNCLLASCPHVHSPVVTSRACWGVCPCLECFEVSHVVLFCFL